MKIHTTYKVKIKDYNHIFEESLTIYRNAVDFYIGVSLNEWDSISQISGGKVQMMYVEKLSHKTANNPNPEYDFDKDFYKFPSYLRRAAINEAIGKVSSYKSNCGNSNASIPKAGFTYPCLYRDNCYVRVDDYTARIKVFIRNTWDWLTVSLKKSDVDYINRHCRNRKECSPTLQKKGKQYYLAFPFEENVTLNNDKQVIASVDLGINTSATVSIMCIDGTVIGRHFLKLPKEKDRFMHSINRIKKAQQHGAKRTPRLWAKAKGINKDISVKTAQFITDIADAYGVDYIVFEHLDLKGKKKGSKKQKLHMWRSRYVQQIVTTKAHRRGIRISRVNAWNTSRLAYDGSGFVERDKDNYSLCTFKSGKRYNCDLSASYNIGARFFIREILKSCPKRERLALVAKVPQAAKRSTCTLSTLISLNAAVCSL